MASQARRNKNFPRGLGKCPTGIRGLDEVTGGGFPRGSPTLVCGAAGCGKTLLANEFLVRGAMEFGENGVFVAFEESAAELAQNAASLGYDLRSLIARGKLAIDQVEVHPGRAAEAGEFSLEGLFVRLRHAAQRVKAWRVVLDTIENLFFGFESATVVRAELQRLFHWLKEARLTAIVTGERGEGMLTRFGIEEYVSDCVIALDHRVSEQLATRRLRVVTYRGSAHGTNEYPFLIDDRGIVVAPDTSLLLDQPVPSTFVSSGVPPLDRMLGGKGYFTGSTVLVSGAAGTGKTSLAASFVHDACRRERRAIYFAFEESARQVIRGIRSNGIDLDPWWKRGLLRFHCVRPTQCGLEMHLAAMHSAARDFCPAVVVIDPLSDLHSIGSEIEVCAMLTRLVDFLKTNGITALLTGLSSAGGTGAPPVVGISSLIDTWIDLRDLEGGGERNRAIYVLKSRGMAHSNQVRVFLLSDHGIQLVDVCIGPQGVLTGSARAAHQMREQAIRRSLQHRTRALSKELQCRRDIVEARIAAMKAELEAEAYRIESSFSASREQEAAERSELAAIAQIRTTQGRRTPASACGPRSSPASSLNSIACKPVRRTSGKVQGLGCTSARSWPGCSAATSRPPASSARAAASP